MIFFYDFFITNNQFGDIIIKKVINNQLIDTYKIFE